MDRGKRQRIMIQIGDLLEGHCKPCGDGKEKTEGQRQKEHCISCKVGKKLQKLGKMLGHTNPTFREGEEIMTLTVAEYSRMKKDGKPDKVIAELYGMDHNAMYRFKKANDLTGKFDVKKKESPRERKITELAVKESSTEQYSQLMDELKHEISQKNEVVDKLQAKIQHFETGIEQYKQALAEERTKYKALEEALNEKEMENEKLRRELESPAEDESIIRENTQLRNENKALQEQLYVIKQALKVSL